MRYMRMVVKLMEGLKVRLFEVKLDKHEIGVGMAKS